MTVDTILNKISRALILSESGKLAANKYREMQRHEGWKFHQGILVDIANQMVEYLLTREYTELPKEEKDIQQRALYISKEVIDFLLNPLERATKYAAIERHNKKMEGTMMGPTGKALQNGKV
jgi:hypothetical protein